MKKHDEASIRFAKPLLAIAVAAAMPSMAMAQQTGALEEIVVTAEHREASLQDTQISLTALSEDAIAELGVSNGLDIGEFIPNLNAQPYVGGRTGISYNIRGIGNSETIVTFDPAVSVYIDGVLIAKNTGSLLDVMELERIEVLRGPQGTLYGRNTMGGAVNYITKKPSDEFEGRVQATLGNYNQRDLRAMLNIPLTSSDSAIGELNMRLSAATLNRDGIQDNLFPGVEQDELGTRDRDVGMVHLRWRPTDTISAMYSFDRTRIDELPQTPWVVTVNPNGLVARFGIDLSPYDADENDRPDDIIVNDPHHAETDVDGHAFTVAWDIGDNMTFHSLTGYRDMYNLGFADSDGSPVPLIFTRDEQQFRSLSQEFRLVGSALENNLDYSVGLFYFEEDGDLYNQTTILGGPDVNLANFANDAIAAYGQFTYHFTERFDTTFGIRYTEEDREMSKAAISGIAFDPIPGLDDVRPIYGGNDCEQLADGSVDCANTVFPEASESFSNVSPMISVSYDWSDDLMTYAKVSSGYQSGGFNARDATWTDFTTGFDEETIIAYELGLKGIFADRFQVNASWFLSDYDDKRVNQFNPETLDSVQRNAGVVEIWGVELELLAQLTDNLQAGFNYGHIDPEYEEYNEPAPTPADPDRVRDLSDSANFPYAPGNSYSAFLAYDYPLNFGLMRARLDWSYRDEMTFLVPVPELNSSENASIVNARVSLDELVGPGDTSVRVSAWVKNLTDEGYWNFGVNLYNSFGFDINTYGEPRTFGVDVSVEF